MDVSLIGVQSNGREIEVPLKRERTVLGRQVDCHVRIPANEVSRNHCEVLFRDGGVEIADMGSRNGTFVNGERTDRRALQPGDLISVGPAVFVVRIDGEPAEIDAAEAYRSGKVDVGGGGRHGEIDRAGEVPTSGGGVMEGISFSGDDESESSSVLEFEFDLEDDEEDDQPPL